jgi:hypothetical protein
LISSIGYSLFYRLCYLTLRAAFHKRSRPPTLILLEWVQGT